MISSKPNMTERDVHKISQGNFITLLLTQDWLMLKTSNLVWK